MRLKSLYIDGYKNLKKFSITFDTDSFIDVFVGKNGSGKSNFFEALIDIFRFLYELNKGKPSLAFDFKIEYMIDSKPMTIEWSKGILSINGEKNRKTLGSTPVPDNMIVYYSGHNEKVSAILKDYLDSFRPRVQKAGFKEMRKIIGIGSDYKQLLLILMLIQPENHKVRRYICEKLSIMHVPKEVKIVLKRPFFADKDVVVERFIPSSAFWGAKGTSKTFLDRLARCHVESSSRDEGYIEGRDIYVFYLDIDLLRMEFQDVSLLNLFIQFDNLKTIDMLESIIGEVTLQSGTSISTDFFSDGQFQSIYIYSIVELFRERTCLTLLDEPDCYLHPEWQIEFLKNVIDIADSPVRNHILLSSHNSVTLVPYQKKKVRFFDIKDNHVNSYELPKRAAIKKLCSDIIKYSEQESILSIINTVQIEKKPVLFTEGSTDPIILKEAWYKLYDAEIPFIPFYAFSCTYIKQLLTDNRIHEEMEGLPIFGLYDFDKAYDQWNGLNGTVIVPDVDKGMIKKWSEGESFAIMLPVVQNPDVRRQVVRPGNPIRTYGGDSHYEIEHIFYGSPITADYFITEDYQGADRIVFKSDHDKTFFAREVVPLIDKSMFEVFRPMFEFLISKCTTGS